MKILLLDVPGRALECGVERLAVNEHIACNDTHGGSLSQNIQKCSLSSSRNTHKGGHTSRLDETRDMVEQSAWLTLDLDIVDDITPSENTLLFLNSTDIASTFIISMTGSPSFLI